MRERERYGGREEDRLMGHVSCVYLSQVKLTFPKLHIIFPHKDLSIVTTKKVSTYGKGKGAKE